MWDIIGAYHSFGLLVIEPNSDTWIQHIKKNRIQMTLKPITNNHLPGPHKLNMASCQLLRTSKTVRTKYKCCSNLITSSYPHIRVLHAFQVSLEPLCHALEIAVSANGGNGQTGAKIYWWSQWVITQWLVDCRVQSDPTHYYTEIQEKMSNI